MSAGEGEERGMQRAAAAAGLEWDGDNEQRYPTAVGDGRISLILRASLIATSSITVP